MAMQLYNVLYDTRNDSKMSKHHTLETDKDVYKQSRAGHKQWEIRFNDRKFKPGDTVTLKETKYSGLEMKNGAPLLFTGNKQTGLITFVLYSPSYGLKDGWVVFSLE